MQIIGKLTLHGKPLGVRIKFNGSFFDFDLATAKANNINLLDVPVIKLIKHADLFITEMELKNNISVRDISEDKELLSLIFSGGALSGLTFNNDIALVLTTIQEHVNKTDRKLLFIAKLYFKSTLAITKACGLIDERLNVQGILRAFERGENGFIVVLTNDNFKSLIKEFKHTPHINPWGITYEYSNPSLDTNYYKLKLEPPNFSCSTDLYRSNGSDEVQRHILTFASNLKGFLDNLGYIVLS